MKNIFASNEDSDERIHEDQNQMMENIGGTMSPGHPEESYKRKANWEISVEQVRLPRPHKQITIIKEH